MNINEKKSYKKLIIALGVGCCLVIIVICCILFLNRSTELETNAKKYIKQLSDVAGDIEVLDVVCFSKEDASSGKMSYNYLIVYKIDGNEDFAFFLGDKDVYAGNGNNGGDGTSSWEQNVYDLQALAAQKSYLEYLGQEKQLGIESDINVITEEDAASGAEGIIPLDIN